MSSLTVTRSNSAPSLVKRLTPYLFKSRNEPPQASSSSDPPPTLVATAGPPATQMQHSLTPAERHFVFTMIPRAFAHDAYVAHCRTIAQLGTLIGSNNASGPLLSQYASTLATLRLSTKNDGTRTGGASAEHNTRVDMMRRILGLASASERMVSKWNVQRAIELFRRSANDTGSAEVQAAIITLRIAHLNDHLKTHRKDQMTRRRLAALEGRRNRHLKYLKRQDLQRYCEVLSTLQLKDIDSVEGYTTSKK